MSTDTLCPVPWGHTSVPVQLFMKGHVAPENLNGGWNNQPSASIVPDRPPPPAFPFGLRRVAVQLSLSWCCKWLGIWLLSLYSKVLHLVTGPTLVTYTPIPSFHHVFPSPTPGSAVCRNASSHPQWEKVSWALTVLWLVCLCACMQVYCAALCVYCSRTQRDGLSQWRAPV